MICGPGRSEIRTCGADWRGAGLTLGVRGSDRVALGGLCDAQCRWCAGVTPNVRVPLGVSTLPRRHALLMTGDYIVTNSDELSSGSHVTLHFASHGLKPGSQSCPARAPKNPSDHAAIGPYLVQPPRTRATTRTRRANVSTPGGLMTRAVNGNVERPCQHPAQPNPWRADGSLSECWTWQHSSIITHERP